MAKLARGLRNNNPLNIRMGIKWQGLATPAHDGAFARFESMTWGARAALVLLRNYVSGANTSHKKFDTLTKIISRWAPPSENNTNAYIARVALSTGINPYERIQASDRSKIVAIASAMAEVECGQKLDKAIFESAWDLI